jgi:hypothetical protein
MTYKMIYGVFTYVHEGGVWGGEGMVARECKKFRQISCRDGTVWWANAGIRVPQGCREPTIVGDGLGGHFIEKCTFCSSARQR